MCQQQQEQTATTRVTPKIQRSVRFFPNAKGKLGLHISNYTEKERARCWYKKQEYIEMKRDAVVTIEMIQRNVAMNDDFHCLRGLEQCTKEGSMLMKLTKNQAQLAVFRAQLLQEKNGIQNPGALAAVYEEASEPAKMSAYLKGISDEKEMLAQAKAFVTKAKPKRDYSSPANELNGMRRTIRYRIPKTLVNTAA